MNVITCAHSLILYQGADIAYLVIHKVEFCQADAVLQPRDINDILLRSRNTGEEGEKTNGEIVPNLSLERGVAEGRVPS
jgi:hypothetical protein